MTDNSYDTLTESIYFLNKSENPFVNLYNQKIKEKLSRRSI